MTGKTGTLHRGRATTGNPANRYHGVHAEAVDDGWGPGGGHTAPPGPVRIQGLTTG
jgi:hypothetical protein